MIPSFIQFGDLKAHLIGLFILTVIILLKNKVAITKMDFWYIGFLFLFVISSLFSTTPYGFKEFATFFGGFLVYLVIKNSTFSFKNFKFILFILLALVCGLSINYFLIAPQDRLDGIFIGYPNVMATFLLLLLPPVIYEFFNYSFQKARFQKITTLLTLIFVSLAFILTFSRGSLLAAFVVLALALGIYAVMQKNLKVAGKKIMFASFLLLAIFGITFLIQESKIHSLDFVSRAISQDVSSAKSVNERLVFFYNSFKITVYNFKNFFIGIGPGSFEFVNPSWQDSSFINSEHPHNIFLKILLENGFFALAFFVIWLVKIVFNFIKIFIQDPDSFKKLLPVFLSICAFFIASLVDYNLGFVPVYVVLFGYLGYISSFFNSQKIFLKNHYLKLTSIILLFIILLQGFYFYQLETNSKAKPFLFEIIPFKEDADQLNTNLQVLNFLATKYPNLHTVNFSLAMQTENIDKKILLLNQAIIQNSYNNFNYYVELFKLQIPTSQQIDFTVNLLQNYNYLLSINAHFTVLKDDPFYANELYSLLLKQELNNDERAKIIKLYNEFRIILFQETAKFDTRYKTNLFNKVNKWNYNY